MFPLKSGHAPTWRSGGLRLGIELSLARKLSCRRDRIGGSIQEIPVISGKSDKVG